MQQQQQHRQQQPQQLVHPYSPLPRLELEPGLFLYENEALLYSATISPLLADSNGDNLTSGCTAMCHVPEAFFIFPKKELLARIK